jgi:hypothetical protein
MVRVCFIVSGFSLNSSIKNFCALVCLVRLSLPQAVVSISQPAAQFFPPCLLDWLCVEAVWCLLLSSGNDMTLLHHRTMLS